MRKKYYHSFLLKIILIILTVTTSNNIAAQQQPKLTYTVSMAEPHTHYFDVEMKVEGLKSDQDSIDIKMAVWTPGSYLVREFARKVEGFGAKSNSKAALKSRKVSKNTWRISTEKSSNITINYKVYSFEWTVRTSILDASHAYINGASLFMYPDKMLDAPATIKIKPFETFKKITTPLKPVNPTDKWTLASPNFDILFDSPIEIGNHEVIGFEAAGIPHRLAIYGGGNHDGQKMADDTKKIVETAKEVFGVHPCEDYTIIQHNTDGSYGGLEHLNSTSLIFPRWNFAPKGKYNRWLGLMSHEYFHLWNVKRIRPEALGPFDYENENYTDLLWVMEGATSYYDDLILLRAGLVDTKEYLSVVEQNFSNLENTPGRHTQCVAEASFDAWIKYYRSDENSHNCCVSYYLKGAVLHNLLDLEILHQSKGEKNFDQVLQILYKRYYEDAQRGFRDDEFKAVVEEVAGKNMDDFWEKYVYGTAPIDYQQYLNYVGLNLVNKNANNQDLKMGFSLEEKKNGLFVKKVSRDTPAYKDGINVNDELIAINDYRVSSSAAIQKVLLNKKAGEKITLLVSRDGRLQTLDVTLANSQRVTYKLEKNKAATDFQKKLYQKWLKSSFDEKS